MATQRYSFTTTESTTIEFTTIERGWWGDAAAPRLPEADALWIFGPTAAGKSALALALAETFLAEGRPAVILNADASQRWADLRILTARPTEADLARVPHALYGTLAADAPASAGTWLAEIVPRIEAARAAGHVPIVVGGTGLYLKALLQGLAALPAVPDAVRLPLREALTTHGLPALFAELRRGDPALAARLAPGDTQRILRGLEILRATGRPLSDWQSIPFAPPLPGLRWHGIRLMPPRAALVARIEARAAAMLANGALEEVEALMARAPAGPILKTIGLQPLADHLRGALPRAEALLRLRQATRQYAKRQTTWARHQF